MARPRRNTATAVAKADTAETVQAVKKESAVCAAEEKGTVSAESNGRGPESVIRRVTWNHAELKSAALAALQILWLLTRPCRITQASYLPEAAARLQQIKPGS